MGMQVHFDLRDVMLVTPVELAAEIHDGEIAAYCGKAHWKDDGYIKFNIRCSEDGLPSRACWGDVVHDRSLVNFLIDHRIPFNAS